MGGVFEVGGERFHQWTKDTIQKVRNMLRGAGARRDDRSPGITYLVDLGEHVECRSPQAALRDAKIVSLRR
jgi:hypothetical protein